MDGKSGFSGLYTAVAETQAPDDALRVADNVVIRSKGAVEPRPGFMPITPEYSMASLPLSDAIVHGDKNNFWDGSAWRASGSGTARMADIYFGSGTLLPPKLRQDSFSSANLRGNLYWPYRNGVLAARAAAQTSWNYSGLGACCEIASLSPSAAGSVFPTLTKWAYRVVVKRTDSNGLIVRSRPSSAVEVSVTGSWGAIQVMASVWVTPGAAPWASQELEIYRTRGFPAAVQPDDEMAMVGSVTLSAFSGTFTFSDKTSDAQRGAALYTSPSQGGIESANDVPPACSCVEAYRGCLFFGNTIAPQRFTISHEWSDRTGQATGFGYRTATGTTTVGGTTITSVSNVTGLQVGMGVTTPGYLTSIWIIASIVGTTVTVSSPMLWPSMVAGDLIFVDAIEVNGTFAPLGIYFSNGPTPTLLQTLKYNASPYRFTAYGITPAKGGYKYTWVIEDIQRNTAPFTIRATHGNETSPAVGLAGGTASTSTMDVDPDVIRWSEPDEPEHVPPRNFSRVGDRAKVTLGMASTRDSMFIFREDGIWRLSGENGEWVIDPFDLTTFVVLPSSIRKLNGRIFALTNKGLVIVSEAGVEVVSLRVSNVVQQLVDNCRANFLANGYYSISGVTGCAAYVDDRNSEYLLLVGSNVLECEGNALVFNDQTGAWTTFSFPYFTPAGAGIDPLGNPLLLHTGGVRKAELSFGSILGDNTAHQHADSSQVVTVSGTGSGPPQIGFSAPHNASVGQVVTHASGQAWLITRILNANYVEIQVLSEEDAPPPFLSGTGAIWGAVTSRVLPHGFAAPGFNGKEWTYVNCCFSRFMGPVTLRAIFSSAEGPLVESAQASEEVMKFYRVSGRASSHLGNLFAHPIPRKYKRAWLLRAGVEWTTHYGRVVLEAIAVDSKPNAPNRPQVSGS